MSILTSFCMFFLSFAPLWVSVLFIDIKSLCQSNHSIWAEAISMGIILLMSIISLIVLGVLLNSKKATNVHTYNIVSVKEEKSITSEYLLAYILPLFAFDFTTWHEVILFMVFFGTFAFLAIRHNHFSINIVLELLGYKFYLCVLENQDNKKIEKIIISKADLTAQVGTSIDARSINNEFSVISSKRKK